MTEIYWVWIISLWQVSKLKGYRVLVVHLRTKSVRVIKPWHSSIHKIWWSCLKELYKLGSNRKQDLQVLICSIVRDIRILKNNGEGERKPGAGEESMPTSISWLLIPAALPTVTAIWLLQWADDTMIMNESETYQVHRKSTIVEWDVLLRISFEWHPC